MAKLPYGSSRLVCSRLPVLASLPLIMTINSDIKAQTLTEFITLAKQTPGKLAFASSGNGGAPHMAGELFTTATSTHFDSCTLSWQWSSSC
jgi:tripartite-type tricarboxylate transporter receptor subunit TctC